MCQQILFRYYATSTKIVFASKFEGYLQCIIGALVSFSPVHLFPQKKKIYVYVGEIMPCVN